MKFNKTALLLMPLLFVSGLASASVGSTVDPIQDQLVNQTGGIPQYVGTCKLYVRNDPASYHLADNADWALFVAQQAAGGNIVSPFYIFTSEGWQVFDWTAGEVHYLSNSNPCG